MPKKRTTKAKAYAKRGQDAIWKIIEWKLNAALLVMLVSFVFLIVYGVSGVLFTTIEASPISPRQYLYEHCREPECNALLLDMIATCESQWRMIKNSQSSAYGYFQILDSTEKTTPIYDEGRRKFDPYANVEMGIYLFETRGSNPWNESRHCWAPKYQRALQK